MSERMSNERRKWIRSIHAEMQRDEFDGADEIIVECLDEIDALKAEVREKDDRVNMLRGIIRVLEEDRNSLEAEVARLRAENAAMREGVLSLCHAYCAGREPYSGKNRHEVNCAAWELDDILRGSEEGER